MKDVKVNIKIKDNSVAVDGLKIFIIEWKNNTFSVVFEESIDKVISISDSEGDCTAIVAIEIYDIDVVQGLIFSQHKARTDFEIDESFCEFPFYRFQETFEPCFTRYTVSLTMNP